MYEPINAKCIAQVYFNVSILFFIISFTEITMFIANAVNPSAAADVPLYHLLMSLLWDTRH